MVGLLIVVSILWPCPQASVATPPEAARACIAISVGHETDKGDKSRAIEEHFLAATWDWFDDFHGTIIFEPELSAVAISVVISVSVNVLDVGISTNDSTGRCLHQEKKPRFTAYFTPESLV